MVDAETVDHVWDIMESVDVCMLTTRAGGALRARPMSARPERAENLVWFLTDVRGGKDDELLNDPHACVSFAEPRDNTYLSVSGRAEPVDDRAKIRELWHRSAKAYWPDGPDDPNIRLIRFHPERAEYWEGPGLIVSKLKMAAAVLTGRQPELGHSEKLTLA